MVSGTATTDSAQLWPAALYIVRVTGTIKPLTNEINSVTINPMSDGHIENRQSRRYASIARVKGSRLFPGEALLKDISITGCCIECATKVDVKMKTDYTLSIYPEKEAKIHSFDIVVECKWVHSGAPSCNIGFSVKQSPGKNDFLKYVDYLSWRLEHGSTVAQ